MLTPEFALAVLFFIAGIAIIAIGAYSAATQRIYYDADKKTIATQVEIPFIGKVRTTAPSIALCFIGLVPLWLGYNLIEHRDPALAKFEGEITIDPSSLADMNSITVGVTSPLWSQTETTNHADQNLKVAISVPDNWRGYTAYAFTMDARQTRPAVIGTSLENPKFKLTVGP
jgi:hypothetical protein